MVPESTLLLQEWRSREPWQGRFSTLVALPLRPGARSAVAQETLTCRPANRVHCWSRATAG